MFRPWVKELIIQAQDKGDYDFLKVIGNAIGKHPSHTQPVQQDKHFRTRLLRVIEAAKILLMTEYPNTKKKNVESAVINAFWKYLENAIDKGVVGENDKIAYDKEYFRKYLKRHGVI